VPRDDSVRARARNLSRRIDEAFVDLRTFGAACS
jgi:hypothetical protein